jgi:8-oxo-dGTP pyrophosphatase MutT (NUDIX family)
MVHTISTIFKTADHRPPTTKVNCQSARRRPSAVCGQICKEGRLTMMNHAPTMNSVNGRTFACFPAAVLAFIINEQEQFLMLDATPRRNGWEVVSGALEANETVLAGVLREVREELGEEIRVRPLGSLHISTFRYDDNVPFMLSLNYLLAYEGGAVIPGDDMKNCPYGWFTLAELTSGQVPVSIPVPGMEWLLPRAVELYRSWRGQDAAMLQPLLPEA